MEVDTQVEEQKQEKPFVPYRQGIILLIKAAQNQNGLRHSDYGRYHKYCCRRMFRLRKSLKFTQSTKKGKKHVYEEKPVTAEEVKKDPKYAQILIFKCEANWAYAMQMKQHAAALSGKSGQQQQGVKQLAGNRQNPNRIRVHYLRRFRASASASSSMLALCQDALQDMSLIEMEAYDAQMQAVYMMESLQFEEALNHLLKSKLILTQLKSMQDVVEQLIFDEKLGQIETFIRQCAMRLQISDSEALALQDAEQLNTKISTAFERQQKMEMDD